MNYLQLCQAVRSRIGLHGTGPSTVVSPTDVEQDIVDAVRDAWIDIQNYREDWDWMKTTESFNTASGTTTYTTTAIAGPSNRVAKFVKGSLWLYSNSKWNKLSYLDEDTFDEMYKNDSSSGIPFHYTILRSNQSVKMQKPNAIYACEIDYIYQPQLLAANTDTPELPVQWHNLIIYLAIQKLSASIASTSTAMEYGQAYAVTMGQMMRQQLPKKTMKTRGIA
jgi:hypothetical protein